MWEEKKKYSRILLSIKLQFFLSISKLNIFRLLKKILQWFSLYIIV
jgi:hypothetical protein